MHAPLHAPKAWIDRFKGQFDQGWDKVREETLARQIKLGVVPADTRLTPRPAEIPAWDSLSPDAKRLYARHQEVFAGFLAYTDHEVGRLLEAIARLPDADNTLILYVAGDNGPSAEGSLTGTINNMMTQNGFPDTVEAQLKVIDEIGGPLHENHYPVGWAWAGSSPFQWMKRVPSHFGGTRNGMVVSWPARIKAKGGLRTQFHHAIDVAPTVYAAAGVPMPTTVDGVKQVPLAGVPMNYTLRRARCQGPAHGAVLRDRRTPRDLQGRLGGHGLPRRALGAGRIRRQLRQGPVGAVPRRPRLLAGRSTWPPATPPS